MIEFFDLKQFEEGYQLTFFLSAIKTAITKCRAAHERWVTYESEGYLNGIEAIVLSIKVSLPSRSPYGILETEKIAICCENRDRQFLKAVSLRKNFPNLPHLNLTAKKQPRELCLFDVPFMDQMYNLSPMGFVERVHKWFGRAAAGELHMDDQPMEPFIMNSIGDIVIASNAQKRIINGESTIDLFPKYYRGPGKYTGRHYIEVNSQRPSSNKKPVFAAMCIKSMPNSNQCINYEPQHYLGLHELLLNNLSIDLDNEIYNFIKKCYRNKELGKSYLKKNLLVIICIPRIDQKDEVSTHEFVVFSLSERLGEIGRSIGCLKKKKRKKIDIYILQDHFERRDAELKRIEVFSFNVLMPFTKKLASDMADVSKELTKKSFAVIGQGALGSQLILNLARQGFFRWRLIDGDTLLPHNFARHGTSSKYCGVFKSFAVKNEIDHMLEESDVDYFPRSFKGITDNKIANVFRTDLILDCSASYSVLFDLAYRDRLSTRTWSAYCCGEGYLSVLLCESSDRSVRIDDVDLQLKIKGLDNPLISHIYRSKEKRQLNYSTSCNAGTSVIAQDLVGIHSGVLSRQIKEAIPSNKPQVFVNMIQKDGFGVDCESFIPVHMVSEKHDGWEFRVSCDAIDEMNRYRDEKLPNETGGVLIGWINNLERIVYVGRALPAPPDSVERPYYFVRGKNGLYKEVQRITKLSNSDLYYVGEWHSHTAESKTTMSRDDINCIEKISGIMLEEGQPAILVIMGDSQKISCNVECGWSD